MSVKRRCPAYSHALAGQCDLEAGHEGMHDSAGDGFHQDLNKKEPLRDHGFPNVPGEAPLGVPKAKAVAWAKGEACPNCGCKELMEITIEMKNPLLKAGRGVGIYIGCPACPYASPMMTRTA